MNFNRNEHSCFVQRLDKIAEKNPILWLPCVVLIFISIGIESVSERVKSAFSHTEQVSARDSAAYSKKPFALRVVAMSLVMAFGCLFATDIGEIAYAGNYNDPSNTDWQNEINVTGNGSFGNMLADEFNQKSEEQEGNAGYNVFSVEMQGGSAIVDYEAVDSSTLVVGIYDESGSQLLTTGSIEVTAEKNIATIDLDASKMPQYFYIKAYLINSETMRPLCTVYECPTYTQEMQEFLSKTIYDFDNDLVLNLDDDTTNNFAVFDENTVFIKENSGINIVSSIDEENLIYVIDNADDTVKNLNNGDIFSMEYSSDSMLIVKVKNITVDTDRVTIYGDKTELEEVFDYFKVEESTNGENSSLDPNSCGEGVTYLGSENGGGNFTAYSARAGLDASVEMTHKVSLESEHIKGTLSIGSKATYKAYYDAHWFEKDHAYFELQVKNTMGIKISGSVKSEAPFKIGEIKLFDAGIVNITVKATIKITVEATISVSGKLTQTSGFKADSDSSGMQNLSTPLGFEPEPSSETKVEGKIKFELIVEISANIEVFKIKLFKAALSLKPYIEIVFKPQSNIISDDKKQHTCTLCISGETHGGITLNFKVEVLKFIKWTPLELTYDIDMFEFYFSIISDNPGFGSGNCPNIAYRVNTQVLDENQVPLLGASVTVDGKEYKTDENGKIKCYLKKGGYTVNVRKDGYESRSKNIKVFFGEKDITIVICNTNPSNNVVKLPGGAFIKLPNGLMEIIDGFKDLINSGSGDINDSELIDPDPIDPDPIPIESDFTYTISNGEVTITGYKGTDTEVVIPDTIEGLPVIYIDDDVFHYCSMTSITISDNITRIGNGVFKGCSNLKEIIIPDSVTRIGNDVFKDCVNLTKITISDSITRIENHVFNGCIKLTEIVIPDNVTWIGSDSFEDCSSLTSIVIPSSVTYIGSGAFSGCTNLEEIIIPYGVSKINGYTFMNCSNLKKIYIPNSVTRIEFWAFRGCTSLTSVDIPESVTSISWEVFQECEKLSSVTIPNSVTFLGSAFKYCTSLESITIPDGVKSIDANTFLGCTNLKNVTIPDSVTSIGFNAFKDCSSIVHISIPDSVTSMFRAFPNCTNLEEITLSNQLTEIDDFSGCSSLKNILIPESVSSIGSYAFEGCTCLTNINIPNNVTFIGYSAFEKCSSLANITIPDSVTSIGDNAFSYCTNLEKVIIPYGVSIIDHSTFMNCTALRSVTISNSVTDINMFAFDGCISLVNLYIPDSVSFIHPNAFVNCSNLTISCNSNSYAESYAKSNNIPYILLNTSSENSTQYDDNNNETYYTTLEYDSTDYITKADDKIYESTFTVSEIPESYAAFNNEPIFMSAGMQETRTFTGLIPNEIYNCYGMKSRKINDPFNSSNLLFISQAVSDSNGNLTINYMPDDEYSNPQIFVKAMTEFDIPNAQIISASAVNDSVSISWEPVNIAQQYKVCSVEGDGYAEKLTTIGTSCTIPNITKDRMYGFIVCSCINGEWSIPIIEDVVYYIDSNNSGGEHTHDFGTNWLCDSTSHWHECSCGEKADISNHIEDNGIITVEPTEFTDGEKTYSCVTCGYVIRREPIPAGHTHIPSANYSSDDTGHWHSCTLCGEKIDFAAHSEDSGTVILEPTETTTGQKVYRCTVCGHERTETIPVISGDHTHSYNTNWTYDGTSHWHECSCGERADISQHIENSGVATVQPTETTEGTKTYSCTVCGYVMRTEIIPPVSDVHTHIFGTNWNYDSTYHWHECSCGERADIDRHTDNGGIVTVQPTSTTSGTKIHSCTVCGYVIYTETIPALGIINRPDNPDPLPDVLPMPVYPSDRNNMYTKKEIELSVRSELTGLSSEGAHIESIRKFFSESATIRLTETADSKIAAELAMNNFDNEKMICYPFDISVYSTATGEKIQLRHSGYITFEIPVPESMVNISDSIAVYHIADGIPEHIESEIITDTNGNKKIRFTAKKFSPYMFTAETAEDITAEAAANSVSSDLMSPVSNGVTVPAIKLPRTVKWIGKKKKYRVIRKRRINDLIFVF